MLLSHIDHQVNLVYTEFDEFLSNFDKLLNHIKQFRPSFTIILGDFNARSKSWWPEDVTSHEGTHIESLTTMHGLQQLISDPTHLLPNSSSCIDLIFTDQSNLAVNSGIHPSLHVRSVITKLFTANLIL